MQPRLLRYFTVMAPAAAKELATATWMAVTGGLSRFGGGEPAFRAWVFTIARHQVGDWQCRSGRNPAEQRPVTDGIEPTAFDLAAPGQGIPTRAALGLVAALPAEQAEAIVLRVVAGLDVGQVAEVMRKPLARFGCSLTGACADWPNGSVPTFTSPGWGNSEGAL